MDKSSNLLQPKAKTGEKKLSNKTLKEKEEEKTNRSLRKMNSSHLMVNTTNWGSSVGTMDITSPINLNNSFQSRMQSHSLVVFEIKDHIIMDRQNYVVSTICNFQIYFLHSFGMNESSIWSINCRLYSIE